MQVALLTDADVFAGTERHILDLAVALRALPDAPGVVIVCPVPSPLATQAQAAGISVIAIPSSSAGVLDGKTVRVLRRLLQSGRVEALHAHNGRTALHAALAKTLARRGRVVVTQHFLTPAHATHSGLKARIFGAAHHWVNRRVAGFIAISRAVENAMRVRGDADDERITTILNALPAPDESTLAAAASVRAELGLDASVPLAVCVARLQKEKNIDTLISAMAILKREGFRAQCLIAGQGDEKASLQAQIERENVGDCVRLLGFQSDVLSLIRIADVFVLPSAAEPFGLVILEAMALGRPVIAVNAGGPPEIVAQDETGVLVPPADPAALAAALRELWSEPARREQMGTAARARHAAQFQPERMAQSVREVYRRALA